MTKSPLEIELMQCRAELAQCQAELKLLKEGRGKGGNASSQKRAAQAQQLREFWTTSATNIMTDLLYNDPQKWLLYSEIDVLVDAVAAEVEKADFPFKATRAKDAIKRHLTSTFLKGVKPYIPKK